MTVQCGKISEITYYQAIEFRIRSQVKVAPFYIIFKLYSVVHTISLIYMYQFDLNFILRNHVFQICIFSSLQLVMDREKRPMFEICQRRPGHWPPFELPRRPCSDLDSAKSGKK